MLAAWTTASDQVQAAPWAWFSTPTANPLARLMSHPATVVGGEHSSSRLTANVAATLADSDKRARSPSPRDARRVGKALRRIEAAADQPLALQDLARETATSPYHFLRTFRQVVGMTPHQFVLHTRLTRAAVRLRTTDEPISAIAFDAGFGDLSTFNRRFRRLMSCSPGAYRSARRRAA